MNKSIILSAMLALSMPAFAADVLYVNGDASQTINGTTSPGWTVTAPIEVQAIDGKFTVEVQSFKDISISTVKATTDGDWTTWNTGEYCISNWVNGVKVSDGVWSVGTNFPGQFVGCTTALEQKAQSMGAADAGMNGDYTFVFDQALTQCQILPHALYLCGPTSVAINGVAFGNWDIANSVKVSKADGKFKFNVTVPTHTDQIQIDVSTTTPLSGIRNWEFYNAGQFSATINNATLGTAVDLAHTSTGFIFAADVPAGDYTVTISEDLSTVTVTEKAAATATVLYVNGAAEQIVNGTTITTSWTITDPVAVPLVDGKFTIKVDNFSNIGISTAKAETDGEDWNTNWNPNKVGFKKDATLGIAKAIETARGASNETDFAASALAGTKDRSFTLIIPEDLSTITILPNQIYIAGGNNVTVDGTTSFTGDWNAAITDPHKVDLDETNGVFAFTLTTTANNYVDIATLFANSGTYDWTTWNKGKFSTEDNAYSAACINTRKALTNEAKSINLEKAGTYNVAVARDMSYVILCEDTEGTIDTGTNNYYATFSNPYSDIELSGEGIEVYNVTVSGEQLVLTQRSDNKVAQGEGVLVKVANYATITVKPIDAGLTAAAESENYLVATPVTAGTVTESGYKLYRLAYDDYTNKTGLGFYLGNDEGSITYKTAKPYKAYLKVPTSQAAQIKKFLINPQPTHVDGINVTEQETEKAIYDISGRRVENPTPGFYIQGNKKIVIR